MDSRYRSGTSLTKTIKEEWRDRLLDELPEGDALGDILAFDKSLMKLDVSGLMQLVHSIRKLKTNASSKEEARNREYAAKYENAYRGTTRGTGSHSNQS